MPSLSKTCAAFAVPTEWHEMHEKPPSTPMSFCPTFASSTSSGGSAGVCGGKPCVIARPMAKSAAYFGKAGMRCASQWRGLYLVSPAMNCAIHSGFNLPPSSS